MAGITLPKIQVGTKETFLMLMVRKQDSDS